MPSSSHAQQFAAQQAMNIKKGYLSKLNATSGAIAMSKMPVRKLKKFLKIKEKLNSDQKKRLIIGLKKLKNKIQSEEYTGNVGGETDIKYADNLQVNEDKFTSIIKPEPNIIAKTFDTRADFDTYTNQSRGISMTFKEIQSIQNYNKAKPVELDKFHVKYENTDAFGNNSTTVIKKLKEKNKLCWTAFSKYESAEEEGRPTELKEQNPYEITINDPIRVTKSITFINDTEGSEILSKFLEKLDI